MSFFDSVPQPPPPARVRQARSAWAQPDEVIPGAVPAEMILIRTGQVAVAISGLRVYPNGFEFTAHVRLHDANEAGWRDPFDRSGRLGPQAPDDILRLGVLYADGRRGATGDRRRPAAGADPEYVLMEAGSSGGSARRWDGSFWVHPLPPAGPVAFIASWPAYGIAETRAELDGTAIRAAAGRAVILWPEDPAAESGGGWSSRPITSRE